MKYGMEAWFCIWRGIVGSAPYWSKISAVLENPMDNKMEDVVESVHVMVIGVVM